MALWDTNIISLNGNWTSVAYGNSLFVGVGNSGDGIRAIVSADNGKTWSVSTTPTYDWRSVTFGNNKFVAISYDGYSMTSVNGVNWVLGNFINDIGFVSIAFGLGMFVAVNSYSNLISRSYNGTVWIVESVSISCSAICFGNGLFVLLGNNTGALTYDGVNWTLQTQSNVGNWSSVCYGNGLYVGVQNSHNSNNGVVISADGITWSYQSTVLAESKNPWVSICYTNSQFVAVQNEYYGEGNAGCVMTSSDGLTWSLQTTPNETQWSCITAGNGVIVALGQANCNRIMTSIDGISWLNSFYYPYYFASSVCYGMIKNAGKLGGGVLVSTSIQNNGNGNYISISSDGVNWNAINVASSLNVELCSFSSVCCGEYNDNSLFIAVGNTPLVNIMTSPDGFTWTKQKISTQFSAMIYSICFGKLGKRNNGLFVVVGDSIGFNNNFLTSVDGITWSVGLISSTLLNWKSVCYGKKMFVAVGDGNVAITKDGLTWTTQTLTNAENLFSICFGAYKTILGRIVDMFVAVGNNCIFTSVDGVNWIEQVSPIVGAWNSVCFGGCRKKGEGNFVIVSNGSAITSVDGVNWFVMSTATNNGWVSVCYGHQLASIHNYFVAVSNQGMVTMRAKDISCTDGQHCHKHHKKCCKCKC